jgi:large repetitive protein
LTRTLRPLAVTATALVLGAGLALAAAMPAMADTPPTGAVIDQQNVNPNRPTNGGTSQCGTNTSAAQTFTAGVTGALTSIQVDLQNQTGTAGTAALSVQAASTGTPSGVVLATATVPATPSGTDFTGVLNLSTPVQVVAGEVYAIVVPGNWASYCSLTETYPGGGFYGLVVNNIWLPQGPNDFYFADYVIPGPVADPASATVQGGSSVDIPVTVSGGTGSGAVTTRIGTAAAHGTATITGTTATYAPEAGFVGTDTFTYIATKAGADSAPATVTVTVTPAPAATIVPAAAPTLPATGVNSTWLVWPALGLLALGLIAVVITRVLRRGRRRA